MNTEDRLRDHLRARAEQIDVELTPGRAGRRRARRLVPALAAAAVAIFAIGGAALLTRSGNPAAPPDEEAASTVTTTAPAAPLTSAGVLQVTRSSFAPNTPGAAGPVRIARLGDGYLAVSAEFGASAGDGGAVTDTILRVWLSDNGASWAEAGEAPPFAGGWPRYVLSTGVEVVVLVEGFDEGASGTFIDAYATADGRRWAQQRLEGPAFPELGPYEFVSLSLDGAAAGPAGVIATGISSLQVDVDAVARERLGLEPGEFMGWMTDEDSVRVELTDGTTRTVTYAELGITRRPGELDLVDRVAWVSADGHDWDLAQGVQIPVPSSDAAIAAAPTGGFVAVGFGERGPGMSMSPDGRTWSPVDLAPFDGVGEFLGVAGDGRHLVALGRMRDGATAAWSSEDGTAWTRLADIPVGDGEVVVTGLTNGPLGTVAALAEFPSLGDGGEDFVEPPLVVRKDGLELRFDFAAGRLTLVDEASGEMLVDEAVDFDAEEPPDFVTVDETGRQITINEPATGEPLFSYRPEDQVSADIADVESGEAVLESGDFAAAARTTTLWYLGEAGWEVIALPGGARASEFDVSDVVVGDGEIVYSVLARQAPGLDPQIWRAAPGS